MPGLLAATIATVILHAFGAGSVAVPSTTCYALDNTSHIHDFGHEVFLFRLCILILPSLMHLLKSNLIGQLFEYEYDDDKANDVAVRFCKDVETRSRPGYVAFGRFDTFNHFVAGSGYVNFVQEYYVGDLMNCEKSYDKLGRTAQVNVICGNCPNGQCAGGLGCICNVTYESTCRVLIDLAIPCVKPGLRVFEGFTVGFHPRSWEIVYNGLAQSGYEKAHSEFSFRTDQKVVTLYLTAVASLSGLVKRPTIKISPDQGLDVRLSGSGAKGSPPTTLSPTMITVEWTCEKARDEPYEIEFTIPIKDYDPIQFTFVKMCEHTQNGSDDDSRGWAIFGILSCVFIIVSTLFCCGGFIYKTRVQNQHGLDSLPGIAILSSCLETASGGVHGYAQPGDPTNPFVNQASWDQQPTHSQGTVRASERTYGSI